MSTTDDSGRPEHAPTAPDKVDTSKAAGVLVLGNTLATLADVLIPLVVVRLAGKTDVAELAALLLVYNTVALVLLTGFPQTVLFFLPARPAQERAAIARRVVRMLLALGVLAGGVLMGIGFASESATIRGLMPGHSPELQRVSMAPLMVMALVPLGDLPARLLPNLFVVEGRPRGAAVYGILRSIAISVATLLPFALGGNAWWVAGALILVGGLQALYVQLSLRALYRGVPRAPAPVSMRELLRFGVPLGATDVISALQSRLDKYLVVAVFPATMWAEYQAGAWQIPIVTTLPYLVGTAMAPRMIESFKAGKPRDAIALWRASIDKVSLIVVPITLVFVVAADEVVELLFTSQYAASAPVLRWYALLGVGRVAAFGTVIVAAGRSGFILQAAIFSLVVKVLLSVPLLLWVGFEGPAMATAFAFIPTVIFYCWCIARSSGLPLVEIFPLARYARIVATALVGVAGAMAFEAYVQAPAGAMLAAKAVIVIGTFALLGQITGLVLREDWRYAWSFVRLRQLK